MTKHYRKDRVRSRCVSISRYFRAVKTFIDRYHQYLSRSFSSEFFNVREKVRTTSLFFSLAISLRKHWFSIFKKQTIYLQRFHLSFRLFWIIEVASTFTGHFAHFWSIRILFLLHVLGFDKDSALNRKAQAYSPFRSNFRTANSHKKKNCYVVDPRNEYWLSNKILQQFHNYCIIPFPLF